MSNFMSWFLHLVCLYKFYISGFICVVMLWLSPVLLVFILNMYIYTYLVGFNVIWIYKDPDLLYLLIILKSTLKYI